MATNETAALRLHATTATTVAETWSLTERVRHVSVTNHAAAGGATVYVTLATAATAAAAETGIVTAVAQLDESWAVLPGQTIVILDRNEPIYAAGSIVGNASSYSINGTP